jgi:hypothetical protein
VLVEVVPSPQVTTATVEPLVALASTFAAFTSFLTTAFVLAVAFLLMPPWPEQAPRPDAVEVVPSLQIVAVD